MEVSHGTCGGNRRRFLKAATAAGAALASAEPSFGASRGPARGPHRDPRQDGTGGHEARAWGRAGPSRPASCRRPSSPACATSTRRSPTRTAAPRTSSARSSSGRRCARTLPRHQECTGTARRGRGRARIFEEHLTPASNGCRTDYADAYYIHGIAGDQVEMLRDPGVKAAFEGLKKAGKIRFAGLSCHDARLARNPRSRRRGRLARPGDDQVQLPRRGPRQAATRPRQGWQRPTSGWSP